MTVRAVWNLFFVGACASLLSACALGKHYSEIDPQGALEDVRQHNGYYALKEITPGTSKLVMRSEAAGYFVRYATSSAPTACEGLEAQGTVVDRGHGVVYPWIAKMAGGLSSGRPFLE